ncbi:Hypothetical protein, putative, partial [Bodo saltans]
AAIVIPLAPTISRAVGVYKFAGTVEGSPSQSRRRRFVYCNAGRGVFRRSNCDSSRAYDQPGRGSKLIVSANRSYRTVCLPKLFPLQFVFIVAQLLDPFVAQFLVSLRCHSALSQF